MENVFRGDIIKKKEVLRHKKCRIRESRIGRGGEGTREEKVLSRRKRNGLCRMMRMW